MQQPVTAVQSEYSLWTRDPEVEVLRVCEELGISFVPYSPMGRGFLTGKIYESTTFRNTHLRSRIPHFSQENRKANQAMVDLLGKIAEQKKATLAQVALAWLLAQKSWIVPIPDTTRLSRFEENIGALSVHLTIDDLQAIENAVAQIQVQGARYPNELGKLTGR